MKVKELVEFANSGKNKLLKADQLTEAVKKEINTKDYIGIKEKKTLVDNIINECIVYENGIPRFDYIEKYICFTMRVIEAYTNLELSDDIEDDYDELCRNELLNVVIFTFEGEYENIKSLLQMKCDYILNDNSIEMQVGGFLTKFIGVVKDVKVVLANKLEELDINQLLVNSMGLDGLSDLINFKKK